MWPYPLEFRDEIVRVARSRDDDVTIEQIATDFGVYPMTIRGRATIAGVHQTRRG